MGFGLLDFEGYMEEEEEERQGEERGEMGKAAWGVVDFKDIHLDIDSLEATTIIASGNDWEMDLDEVKKPYCSCFPLRMLICLKYHSSLIQLLMLKYPGLEHLQLAKWIWMKYVGLYYDFPFVYGLCSTR